MKSELEKSRVAVLLSTYNGEKWLPHLLQSLELQADVDIDLIWRDDMSNDSSMMQVVNYSRINKKQCQDIEENIGASLSFMHLLQHAKDYEYVAFCDQDDVWDPNKLIIATKILAENPNIPKIYASKVRILNEETSWPVVKHDISLVNAIFQNVLMGCTIVLNKAAVEILIRTPFPKGLMHDSWIYCVGANAMNIHFDEEPHMDYRIHKYNDTGIKAIHPLFSKSTLLRVRSLFKVRHEIQLKIKEITGFNLSENLNGENTIVTQILTHPNVFKRASEFHRFRFRQNSFENLVFKTLWVIKFF